MGKILGALIGLVIFGPIGLLAGLFIGFIIDSNVKSFNFSFFNQNDRFLNQEIIETFPVLAAEIINSGNVDKISILNLKNLVIEIFGIGNAKSIMAKIKYYIENGYTQYKLDETCEYLYINADINSKINLINILFSIIKSGQSYTQNEINTLNTLAGKIGVSINNNYSQERSYDYYNYNQQSYSKSQKDIYEILEIDKNATNDQIKKQYRTLCKKYHPDKSVNLPEKEKKSNENKIKEIINAYEDIKKERNIK